MAGRPATLRIDILADARGVGRGVDEAEGKLSKLGGGAKKVGAAMGVGLAAAGAAAVAFGASSVKAFVEAEQASARLDDALARFPKTADKSRASFDKLNESLAAKTRFDDDATASGQAVLAQFNLTGSQIQKLTPLLQDYAAKTGKELPDAAQVLGKALQGKGKALSEVGIKFKDAGSTGANFDQIMGGLRTQVGGFAEKEGKTAAGQVEILKNRFGEVQETVGAALLPALNKAFSFIGATVLPVAQRLATQLATKLAPSFKQVGAFVTANVLPVIRSLAAFFTGTLVPAVVAIYGRYLPALKGAFGTIGTAVSNNRDSFAKLSGVLSAVGTVVRAVAPVIGTVMAVAVRTVGTALGVVIGIAARLIDTLAAVISKIKAVASAVKNSPIGKGLSAIFADVPLTGGPSLVGGYGGGLRGGTLTTAALTTAALGDSGQVNRAAFRLLGPALVAAPVQNVTINVSGVLDEAGAADAIRRILNRRELRFGT